jgi:hypothetical protein
MIPIAQKLVRLRPREHALEHTAAAKHPPSLTERLLAEYERGRQEAAASAEKKANERLEQQAREFADARAAERAQWAKAEGEKLAQAIHGAIAALEARLQEDVAKLLQPFLEAKLRAKAAAEFGEALRALLKNDGGVRFEIRGPGDLVEALVPNLGELAYTVRTDTASEVSTRCDRTLIETRLRPWLAALAEADN